MRRPRRLSRTMISRLNTAKAQDWRRKHFKRQLGLCAYCKSPMVMEPENSRRAATLDHVIPLSRGGEHHWENTVCACRICNHDKGNLTAEEFADRRRALEERREG